MKQKLDKKLKGEYARWFASQGGMARKAKRTPEELSAWGKKANEARIKKYGLKKREKKV